MTETLYSIAVAIDAFNSPVLAAGLLATSATFVFLRSKGHAVALVLSSLFALLLSSILKILFAVPRLDSALVEVTGYRFPSRHALIAGAFFSSLTLSAFCLLRSSYSKALVFAVSLGIVVVVGWSRVFLHAHLPVDVIVGSLLGIAISLVTHCFLLSKDCMGC